MKKTIRLKSGEKAKIYSRSFSSVPLEYEFQAQPLGVDRLDGDVEVVITQLFFRQAPVIMPLRESNVVKAGLWDTFVNIYVIARSDLEVTVPKRNLGSLRWVMGLAALIVLAAVTILIATL